MFDDDENGGCLPARRWSWVAAAGAFANMAGNMGRAVTAFCDDISTLAAQHTAVQYDRDDLMSSAQRDLESLPVSDE